MPRPKLKKTKVRINISIDKDVLDAAKLRIDNISAYLQKCLKNACKDKPSTSHNDYCVNEKKPLESCLIISDAELTKLLEGL